MLIGTFSLAIIETDWSNDMNLNFLDFEQPIAELEAKIDELRYVGDDSESISAKR